MSKKQKEWEAKNREREKCKKEQLERDQASRREHQRKQNVKMQQIWDDTEREIARERKRRTEELTREFDKCSVQRHSRWASEETEKRKRRQKAK